MGYKLGGLNMELSEQQKQSFRKTSEYQQMKSMLPACEEIYRKVFNAKGIKRTQDTALDLDLGIDVILTLPSGSILTGQEKALSHQFEHHNTLTMEFYQNRDTKEPGEFFKIASQFYLSGYINEQQNAFTSWHIINLCNLIQWLGKYPTSQLEKKTIPSTGYASFIAIPYKNIPVDCIIAKSEDYYRAIDSKG